MSFYRKDLLFSQLCDCTFGGFLIYKGVPTVLQKNDIRKFVCHFLCIFSSVGVPGNLPIFGESGGISRLYQLAEWFGPCDLIAERDFISRSVFISFYLHPHARVRTLFTYTRSLHAVRHLNSRQAIHAKHKQPSGYTLRLRHTRNIRYALYNPNANSGDIFILMHIVRASESDGSVFPCMISLILGELMPKRAAAFF